MGNKRVCYIGIIYCRDHILVPASLLITSKYHSAVVEIKPYNAYKTQYGIWDRTYSKSPIVRSQRTRFHNGNSLRNSQDGVLAPAARSNLHDTIRIHQVSKYLGSPEPYTLNTKHSCWKHLDSFPLALPRRSPQ